jgi:hypothetical protein
MAAPMRRAPPVISATFESKECSVSGIDLSGGLMI